MSNRNDDAAWPYEYIDTRKQAMLQYQYGQASLECWRHVYGGACQQCGINGLCPVGTELNRRCRELEEELYPKEEEYYIEGDYRH